MQGNCECEVYLGKVEEFLDGIWSRENGERDDAKLALESAWDNPRVDAKGLAVLLEKYTRASIRTTLACQTLADFRKEFEV